MAKLTLKKQSISVLYKLSTEIKENKNIGFGNASKKETAYARKDNLFFATCLHLITHENLLQEIQGKSEKTLPCLILGSLLSLSDLMFKKCINLLTNIRIELIYIYIYPKITRNNCQNF